MDVRGPKVGGSSFGEMPEIKAKAVPNEQVGATKRISEVFNHKKIDDPGKAKDVKEHQVIDINDELDVLKEVEDEIKGRDTHGKNGAIKHVFKKVEHKFEHLGEKKGIKKEIKEYDKALKHAQERDNIEEKDLKESTLEIDPKFYEEIENMSDADKKILAEFKKEGFDFTKSAERSIPREQFEDETIGTLKILEDLVVPVERFENEIAGTAEGIAKKRTAALARDDLSPAKEIKKEVADDMLMTFYDDKISKFEKTIQKLSSKEVESFLSHISQADLNEIKNSELISDDIKQMLTQAELGVEVGAASQEKVVADRSNQEWGWDAIHDISDKMESLEREIENKENLQKMLEDLQSFPQTSSDANSKMLNDYSDDIGAFLNGDIDSTELLNKLEAPSVDEDMLDDEFDLASDLADVPMADADMDQILREIEDATVEQQAEVEDDMSLEEQEVSSPPPTKEEIDNANKLSDLDADAFLNDNEDVEMDNLLKDLEAQPEVNKQESDEVNKVIDLDPDAFFNEMDKGVDIDDLMKEFGIKEEASSDLDQLEESLGTPKDMTNQEIDAKLRELEKQEKLEMDSDQDMEIEFQKKQEEYNNLVQEAIDLAVVKPSRDKDALLAEVINVKSTLMSEINQIKAKLVEIENGKVFPETKKELVEQLVDKIKILGEANSHLNKLQSPSINNKIESLGKKHIKEIKQTDGRIVNRVTEKSGFMYWANKVRKFVVNIFRNMFSGSVSAPRRSVQSSPAEELEKGKAMAIRVIEKQDPSFAVVAQATPERLYFKLSEVLVEINKTLKANPSREDLRTTELECITAMKRLRPTALNAARSEAVRYISENGGAFSSEESKNDLPRLRDRLQGLYEEGQRRMNVEENRAKNIGVVDDFATQMTNWKNTLDRLNALIANS